MAWSISYPPTAAHLCLLLSTLCVSSPDAHKNEQRISNPKVFRPSAPNLIIVTELSKYFLFENDSSCVLLARQHNSTQFTSILDKNFDDLIVPNSPQPRLGFTRKSQFLSVSDSKTKPSIIQYFCYSGPPPKFVLFDSRLDAFKLPISSNVEEVTQHTLALPIIEKIFEWIGVFEAGLWIYAVMCWTHANPKFARFFVHPVFSG